MLKQTEILLKITDVIIRERQRKDLGDIPGLAQSMAAHGQIQAIGVNERNEIIWGRRRLAAATLLQWENIRAVKRDGLTIIDEQLLEWEEDYRQKPRDWKEKCVAVSKLYVMLKDKATLEGAEAFTAQAMVDFTGIGSKTSINYMLAVAREIEADPQGEISKTANLKEALKIFAERRLREATQEQERRRQMIAAQVKPARVQVQVEPFSTDDEFNQAVSVSEPIVSRNEIRLLGFNKDIRDIKEGECPKVKLALTYRAPLVPGANTPFDCSISWLHPTQYDSKKPPLIWHTPGDTAGLGSFALDYKFGFVENYLEQTKQEFPASSVHTAPLREDKYLPISVVNWLLNATTLDGDLVLCLGYVNPADVAACALAPKDEPRLKHRIELEDALAETAPEARTP